MSYTIELNNARNDANFVSGQINGKSAIVEIFSAMVAGKDLSKYGKKADKAAEFIGELNQKAASGDMNAVSELNELRRFIIEPVLMQEMKLLSIFGNYQQLSFNDSAEVEVLEYDNVNSTVQALGQDVKFPTITKKRVPIALTTISAGYATDYRKNTLDNQLYLENQLLEQIRIDMRNKASKYVIDTVYNAIKTATGVKYFFEGAGLTKTGVDDVLTKVRRWGKPTIIGDYALVSQLNGFVGYQGKTPVVAGIPDSIMEEINNNGILAIYNGAIVSEMANPYQLSKLNATGDNFDTVLPVGLGFVIPQGAQSPVYTVTRGGLTSMSGSDVTTGQLLQRLDLNVGCIVAPNHEYELGLISDTSL